MSIRDYLLDNRKKFPEEYWCYYDVWMTTILQELKTKSIVLFRNYRRLEYICNLLDAEVDIVLRLLPPSMMERIKQTPYTVYRGY